MKGVRWFYFIKDLFGTDLILFLFFASQLKGSRLIIIAVLEQQEANNTYGQHGDQHEVGWQDVYVSQDTMISDTEWRSASWFPACLFHSVLLYIFRICKPGWLGSMVYSGVLFQRQISVIFSRTSKKRGLAIL